MKLSIETTVGAAVAVAFAVLSMAVIAAEQSDHRASANNSVLSHISARGFNGSSSVAVSVATESPLLAQY